LKCCKVIQREEDRYSSTYVASELEGGEENPIDANESKIDEEEEMPNFGGKFYYLH